MTDDTTSPRLYIQATLASGGAFPLPESQAHYARNVMRLGAGDSLRLFNGHNGEWRGDIVSSDKKAVIVKLAAQLRPQPATPPATHLIFAPIKKTQMEWMIEKAVELGATDFHPVLTQHTDMRHLNEDRLRTQIIEAAEQCERLDIPALHPLVTLDKKLQSWTGPKIFAALERAAAPALAAPVTGDIAFLIGPEGGFSTREKEMIAAHSSVSPVSLGTLILRAETAALKMLALRG